MEKSIKEKIVDIVSEYAGNVSEDVENRLDMVLEGLHDNILEWLRSTYAGATFYKFDEYLNGLLLGDEEELKPCPLCGSKVSVISSIFPEINSVILGTYNVACSNEECLLHNGTRISFHSEKSAVKYWNDSIK